eukprot:jgi/Tetstr1/424432/TSEL_001453.t1
MWRPRNDEADRYLTEANKIASRDEYRHLLCYGVYHAAANAAAKTALATLRAPDTPTQDRVDALDLLDAARRTLEAVGGADEARLTYLRRFKAKKALITHRGGSSNAARRTPRTATRTAAGPTTRFATDVPHRRTKTLYGGRRVGWEKSSCAWWVSRAFFVRKPGDNQWRFIIDLRVLNTFCARKRLRMETLMGDRHLTAKGDYMFSFDLQDGFYALGIAPSDRDYFTVNIRGTFYWLGSLPMGWSVSPYYFTTFTMTFVKHLHPPPTPAAPGNVPRLGRWLRRGRWRGARILPYVDDFLMFASSEPEALELRHRVADLLDSLGLLRNPAKGLWEPVQYGQHLGVDIDTATGYYYAPVDKLQRLARQAKHLLQRAARDARWLPVRELQSLVGRAQYLFLAIPAARFYLWELHDVVGSKWGGRVRMTHQLRRNLQWWTAVPTHANGRPIHRPVETAYMHCDSSGYGWGAVLNVMLESRGFLGAADERQHITWKEVKAARLAVESFLPHLAGRRMLLHEDNQAVCSVLAGLTSRSPAMMAELHKLWYLLDSNGVHIRARYIRQCGMRTPSIGFASALNAMLPRYNAAWLDPGCEAVDSLHLADAEWRRENNYCNPPWPLLPDMVQKLRQSGAAATVVAPRWEGKVWHHALTEMAVAERVFSAEQGVPPLDDTAATVARYIAWQGLRGTVKAASLQPYLSAINGFYRDHGAEPVAQGDLISKGAATAAYAIGVVLQKIKHFGGWAQLSSVVLDYIDPTALPCAASWQLFGWLTPWELQRPG